MPADAPPADPPFDAPAPVRDEEKVLERVLDSLRARVLSAASAKSSRRDYDTELVALRDQIAEARLEDAPPLIAQMERLQAIAMRRGEVATGTLDARTPYFAHMRLKESDRIRDVCLGRATYLDAERGVRVVDWRNAPVSRLYYRYQEGDPYEELFGDKSVEGEMLVRRDVTIAQGKLVRVGASDATYVRSRDGNWRTLAVRATRLAGGQGTAVLPDTEHGPPPPKRKPGTLGEGHGTEELGRRDRFLPEIAALLDPKQFEAISRPAAGVVVIQGGAGSGKTTIGLHRIAYLAFQAPKRFTPDRVIVIVPSRALAAYTSRVLPSLEVPNIPVVTLAEWQRDARLRALPMLPSRTTDETPPAVVKLKKHPALLELLDRRVDEMTAATDAELRAVFAKGGDIGAPFVVAWDALSQSPIAGRLAGMRRWLLGTLKMPGVPAPPPPSTTRLPIEHAMTRLWRRTRELVWVWAEVLTDRSAILGLVESTPRPGLAPLTRIEVEEAHRWCSRRCEAVLSVVAGQLDDPDKKPKRGARDEGESGREAREDARMLDFAEEETLDGESITPEKKRSSTADDDEKRPAYREDGGEDEEDDRSRSHAVDGRPVDEEEALGPALDAEDDAILLRLHQRIRGPLHGRGKQPLLYEHVFVDEVQDCAAIDLAVLVACTDVVGGERSMTLAGDIAQRLTLDTGLGEFAPALERLGLPHVEVEPLTIGYRSTRQVLALAREVLGPLAPETPPIATRDGAPVELHPFGDAGAAAAFLASALRDLSAREPMASVALIARHGWQADIYYDVLSNAEVPNLRRVKDQDFPFRAGIDVTDVKQVKGLEWDYVVLLDVNAQSYGNEDESRHLLHIAATRAAHQLWLIASAEPSPLAKGWDG